MFAWYNNTKYKALRGTGEKYLKHLAGVEPTTSWFPVTMLYHWATRASCYVFTNTTHGVLRAWFPRSGGVLLVFPSCLPPYSRKPTGLSQWSMPYRDVIDIIIQSTRPCEGQAKNIWSTWRGSNPRPRELCVMFLYRNIRSRVLGIYKCIVNSTCLCCYIYFVELFDCFVYRPDIYWSISSCIYIF